MTLELNDHETQALRDALGSYLRDFQFEIARTDARDYRHALRETFQTLEAIQRRLEGGVSSVQPRH